MSADADFPAAAVPVVWIGDRAKVRLSDGTEEDLYRFVVLVNGHKMDRIWSADTRKGEVEQIVIGVNGAVIEETKGQAKLRTLRGAVEIRRRRKS